MVNVAESLTVLRGLKIKQFPFKSAFFGSVQIMKAGVFETSKWKKSAILSHFIFLKNMFEKIQAYLE